MTEQTASAGILEAILLLVRVLLVVYAGYALLLFVLQRTFLFPGTHLGVPSGRSPPEGVEQVWLETSFGRVEAWLIASEGSEPGPGVLFTHGNGELMDDWAEEMAPLSADGLTVLLVEYPGYGLSEGKPSRTSIRETMQVAYDTLTARGGVDPGRIVAWGRSLGGGAAGDLALDRPLAALILQSTFTATGALAWEFYKAPPVLVRDRWDTRRALKGFDGPVLLMHGRRDEVIPFSHAERLAGVREGLEVTEIPCGHNDCLGVWPEIRKRVLGFLRGSGVL